MRAYSHPSHIERRPNGAFAVVRDDPASCAHDVVPIVGYEDWGRCTRCGDESFPMTNRSAQWFPDRHRLENGTVVEMDQSAHRATESARVAQPRTTSTQRRSVTTRE